uniref:Uncharacterized protein n=1 Tax=Photinus pyralis TaxID=7054 RepID=A0A1Y1MPN9_PHOPY
MNRPKYNISKESAQIISDQPTLNGIMRASRAAFRPIQSQIIPKGNDVHIAPKVTKEPIQPIWSLVIDMLLKWPPSRINIIEEVHARTVPDANAARDAVIAATYCGNDLGFELLTGYVIGCG